MLQPSLELEMRSLRGWGVALSLPAVLRLPLSSSARPPAMAFGDICASVEASLRVEDWIIGADLAYTHPSGIWDPWESAGRGIRSGSGRSSIGLSARATRLSDPVALGLSLGVEAGLTSLGSPASAGHPLSLRAGMHCTYAVNGSFSITAVISPSLAWPEGLGSASRGSPPRPASGGTISASFSDSAWSLGAGISKVFSDPSSPATIRFGWTRRFHAGREP